jgi:hypothetical protein
MDRFVHPLVYRFLVRTDLVSSDYENYDTWEVRRGKIRRLRVVKGYFQSSERQAPGLRDAMRLREQLRDRAWQLIAAIVGNRTPVFVQGTIPTTRSVCQKPGAQVRFPAFRGEGLDYIAPKYWSGWSVKKWYPPELRGSFVTEYLDVEPK